MIREVQMLFTCATLLAMLPQSPSTPEIRARTVPESQESEERSKFDVEPVVVRRGPVALLEDPASRTEAIEEAILRGELTRMKGAKGRLPAVFFLSGSGFQDRTGFSSGIHAGTHEILDHLTSAGFLVLRMDDRGAGESTGPLENMSYAEVVADGRACLEYLLDREDVDSRRVALIGHSEGGITASILGLEKSTLAAVVLMAAPARPIPELIEDQIHRAMDEMGMPGEQCERYRDDVVRSLGIPPDAGTVDPKANVARLTCPVLVLQGGKDIQVSLQKDARVLVEALDAAKHADHELVVFPELDHLFKRALDDPYSPEENSLTRPVDPGFIESLTKWLSKRMNPGPPR